MFKKIKQKIRYYTLKFEKKTGMINTKISFKSYRKKYLFTDFEILFFIFSLVCFLILLIFLYFDYGVAVLVKYMFFLFLMPTFILFFFDFKAKIANRKKTKQLKKRELQKSEQLKKILLMEKDEDEGIVSNYIPIEKVEFSKKDFIDVRYELKMLSLERNVDAVIGIQFDGFLVSGYLAKLK